MNEIKVLIVDDEVEFALTLAERMELRGMNVQVAHNGEEALEKTSLYHPDVVVLDLKMPDMSGLEVLDAIKARDADIEVIMLTGHGSTTSGIEGMERGAFDYIMKPVDLAELLEKIRQAGDVRREN